MMFLTAKILLCLFLAALIGVIAGWLLRRISAVEREAQLTGEIEVRNDRVSSLEEQLSERDTKVMSLGTDLERWQSKVPELESTIAERDDQVMGLTMDIDSWKQKVPQLERQLGNVETECEQLSSDLAEKSQNLVERDNEVGRLTGEVTALRKQLADVNERSAKETADFNAELTSQRQQLDGVRAELATSVSSLQSEKDVAAAMTTKVSSLQDEMEALKLHSDAQTKDSREREQALNELRQSLKAQEAERLSLAEQVTTLSPVALRVTSQDQSITSLNQDLRTRDTTIKGLQDQLSELRSQAEELTQSTDSAASVVQAKISSNDKEWRARLRIADSGRQQAQADLYRRQEQIDRLQRQLKEAQAQAQASAQKALASTPAGASSGSTAQSLFGTTNAGSGLFAAGTVATTDERQWKSQLRIAESARRRAEADVQRQNERVNRLEARLRESTTPAAVSPATRKPETQPTAVPKVEADLTSTRFLTSAPKDQDDLQKIKGVGKVLKKTLNSLGIYQFRQVALFSLDDIAWVDDRLKFKGRIERDEWVSQAAILHREKYGSDPKAG